MELTEPQWKVIEPLFPPPKATGRPRQDDRLVLEAVLWVLRTGARWKDLPGRFPSYQTCHRRFQQWVRSGLLDRILQALYEDLIERGRVKLDEWFTLGSFVPAKGGAVLSLTVPEARAARSWQSRTAMVDLSLSTSPLLHRMKLPWSRALSMLPSASITPPGSSEIPPTTATHWTPNWRQRAPVVIARNRRNRTRTQDGRPLRRAKRRFVVERLFAWLQKFRRLVVRYEHHAENFLGMVRLAAMLILLRHF